MKRACKQQCARCSARRFWDFQRPRHLDPVFNRTIRPSACPELLPFVSAHQKIDAKRRVTASLMSIFVWHSRNNASARLFVEAQLPRGITTLPLRSSTDSFGFRLPFLFSSIVMVPISDRQVAARGSSAATFGDSDRATAAASTDLVKISLKHLLVLLKQESATFRPAHYCGKRLSN